MDNFKSCVNIERNGSQKSQLTAWRLLKDIRLVVPIYGCFSIFKHLFVFFLFGLAMTRRLDPNLWHMRYEYEYATVHARRLFPAPAPSFWLCIKYGCVFGVACFLSTPSALGRR